MLYSLVTAVIDDTVGWMHVREVTQVSDRILSCVNTVFHILPVENVYGSLMTRSKVKVTKSNGELALCSFIYV